MKHMEKIKKILSRIDALLERNMEASMSDGYFNGQNVGLYFAKEAILGEFPELRESEDDATIRELLSAIKSARVFDVDKEVADRWAACLERLKESLHIPETCKENSESFTGVPENAETGTRKEQKPAEWSEEDALKLQSCIVYLLHTSNEIEFGGYFGDKARKRREQDIQKNIVWLKSLPERFNLRPQPHWKPSEEQMKQLNSAAGLPEFGPMVTTKKQYPALEGLY